MISDRIPRVLMVVTRDIPEKGENGRERTMRFIKHSLSAGGIIETFRLDSVLECPSLQRLLAISMSAFYGILRGQPIPLQTLLFLSPRYFGELQKAVEHLQPETVYFDGVRSGIYALALRRSYPCLNLVCDFDDLMSLRMKVLAKRRQPISVGNLKKFIPVWVQRYILDGIIVRAIQAYEHRALRSIENRIGLACNKVVLVSSVDAEHFRLQCPSAQVEVIAPFVEVQRHSCELDEIQRFIFIGTDSLLQNRLTIEYLLAAWQRLRPKINLHIFGKQSGDYASVPGVVFRGFIDDLADAYLPGSVLLAPSFVSGGVKTKVLEAISYGVVPIGNHTTFEGIDADCSRITLSEQQFDSLVCAPEQWMDVVNSFGMAVVSDVANNHDSQVLGARWRICVWPSESVSNLL